MNTKTTERQRNDIGRNLQDAITTLEHAARGESDARRALESAADRMRSGRISRGDLLTVYGRWVIWAGEKLRAELMVARAHAEWS